MTRSFLKSSALAAALALSAWAPSAAASVIIGNLAAANNGNFGFGTPVSAQGNVTSKAAGFAMNAGTDFLLDSVTLTMTVTGRGNPLVSIYSDNGSNAPGSVLFTLTDPATFAENPTFTAASAFTLFADTKYWLMVQNTGADEIFWNSNAPSILPTGADATALGYLLGGFGGPATGSSSVYNTFEVHGTAIATASVPEPATVLLVAGAMLGLAWQRRAPQKASTAR